jgi:hypothetical protein
MNLACIGTISGTLGFLTSWRVWVSGVYGVVYLIPTDKPYNLFVQNL